MQLRREAAAQALQEAKDKGEWGQLRDAIAEAQNAKVEQSVINEAKGVLASPDMREYEKGREREK